MHVPIHSHREQAAFSGGAAYLRPSGFDSAVCMQAGRFVLIISPLS